MNQFRRSIFKSRLPEKLKPWIMYNVPSESQWFLGFDFCKKISQINNMISALAQLLRLISRIIVRITTVVGSHMAVNRR